MQINDIYKFFADYVYKHCGIVYKAEEYYRLETRLKMLADHFEKESIEQIYDYYQGAITKDMHSFLIDLCTNNETYFMRDMKPFKMFGAQVLKDLAENTTGEVLLWSCACSRGQEPYSALMSADTFGKANFDRLRIDATDISTEMISVASNATYTILEVQRGLPAPFLVKYLEKTDESHWKIKASIRDKINFKEFNLLSGVYPINKYSAVFCRNVLIYQNVENRKSILTKLYDALKPGGYLLMGAGESMIGIDTKFKLVKFGDSIFYQK